MTKLRAINWVYAAALVIVYGFMGFAGYKSYGHLVDFFLMLGASKADANAAPIFVDGFVFLGWLGRRRRFAARTRRIGLRMMLAASVLSFAGNVTIGIAHSSFGSALFGGMLVVGYLVAEWYADQLAPAKSAKKCAEGCTCRRHSVQAEPAAPIAAVAAAAPVVELAPVPARAPQPVHPVTPTRPRTGAFGLPRQPLGERVSVLTKTAA